MAQSGATQHEIAHELGISHETLHVWRCVHPEFADSLKLGRDAADERIEASLYARAAGYTREAYKVAQSDGRPCVVRYVEHVPPDVATAFIWLKNRRPAEWRDRHEHVSLRVNAVRAMSTADILAELARLDEPAALEAVTCQPADAKPALGQDIPTETQ